MQCKKIKRRIKYQNEPLIFLEYDIEPSYDTQSDTTFIVMFLIYGQ